MSVSDQPGINPFYQIDSYGDFVKGEGVPIVEAYAVDCLTQPLEPWPRLGGLGAYLHLVGRGDMLSCYLSELPAGGHLNPEKHMHDEEIYVVSGRGATTVELPGGRKHTFEWGPGSLFGIPMNAPHQHFNGSGSEPARICAVTNLAILINLFHSSRFIYDNDFDFSERAKEDRYFTGDGEFRAVKPGRHQWETNFVPDLTGFQLPEWQARGAAGRNIQFCLADSTMHAHISEFGVGTYKKAHRHGAGAHIFCVTGQGYSLLWREGQDPVDTVRVNWKPGTLYAPPDGPTYHQHFNIAPIPSRYLALGFGGMRYMVFESRRASYENMDKSVADGGNQIEYQDEDPRIFALYRKECAKQGVEPAMQEFLAAR